MIVMNMASGSSDGQAAREAVQAALAAAGRPFRTLLAHRGADIPELARVAVEQATRRNGIVVAAGGDGTLNAVAQAVLPSGRPFGVLPQGTFNYFARSHGLPLDPAEAARVWLHGHVAPVQVGQVNGHAFLVNASLGLYPKLLAAREEDNAQFGRHRSVAIWAGLRTIWRERHTLRLALDFDGAMREVRTPTLFVANNPLQLEQLGFAEAQAVQHDGRLAAIMVHPVGLWPMLKLCLRGAMGELGQAEEVLSHAFRHLTVKPLRRRQRMRIQVAYDGELRWLAPPLRFEVAAQPLHLLVPRPGGEGGASDGR